MKVTYSIRSMQYVKKRIILCHVVYYTFMFLIILIAFLTMVQCTFFSLSLSSHIILNNKLNPKLHEVKLVIILIYLSFDFRFTRQSRCMSIIMAIIAMKAVAM